MREFTLQSLKLSTHYQKCFRRVFSDNKTFKAQLKLGEFYHIMTRSSSEIISHYFNEESTQVYTENYLGNMKGELFRVYYYHLYRTNEKDTILEKGIEAITYEKALSDTSLFAHDRAKIEFFYEISKKIALQAHLHTSLPESKETVRKRKI